MVAAKNKAATLRRVDGLHTLEGGGPVVRQHPEPWHRSRLRPIQQPSSPPAGVVWSSVASARSLWPDRPGLQHLAAVAFLTPALPDLPSTEVTCQILTADRQQ